MAHETSGNSIEFIQEGFALLQIREEELPDYEDPYSFAESFRICSLYSENEVFSSDAVNLRNVESRN